MPKIPDMPCAGCGRPMWRSTTSLPVGQARCRECRRANPTPPRTKPCAECLAEFVPHSPRGKFCSTHCAGTYNNRARQIRHPDDSMRQRFIREQVAPGLTQHARRRLLREWRLAGRACAYCERPCETVDHVVPLARGGTNYEGNLVPCCRSCNSSKSWLLLVEWRTGRRLRPMPAPLGWNRASARKPKPVTGAQLSMTACAHCGALHLRPKFCSQECSLAANAVEQRNKYRRKVGIPDDAPLYSTTGESNARRRRAS